MTQQATTRFHLTKQQAKHFIRLQTEQHLTYRQCYDLGQGCWPVTRGVWEKELRAWRKRLGMPAMSSNAHITRGMIATVPRHPPDVTPAVRSQPPPHILTSIRAELHRQGRCHYCHQANQRICCNACVRILRTLLSLGYHLDLCDCPIMLEFVRNLLDDEGWKVYAKKHYDLYHGEAYEARKASSLDLSDLVIATGEMDEWETEYHD